MNEIKKRIMITGNLGYIGTVLTEILLSKGYFISGYDIDFYKNCEIYEYAKPNRQIKKDIRDVSSEDLKNIDAIIHLAALSNDPLGELNPELTEEINYKSTIKLAKLAKANGVKRFIYSSSQSMYGVSDSDDELDEDNSLKNPLTSYAVTKWKAECALKELCSDDFTVVCFRPSTVFGASPKLRCDIVYNNLLASAFTGGKIEIKSDGTPWRPVVHVKDVSMAFIAGLEAPVELIQCKSFNVGIKNGNYTVRELAEAVQNVLPNCSLIFTGEHGTDSRTYKVSFKRILSVLKNHFKPEFSLNNGGNELKKLFEKIGFNKKDFNGAKCTRLVTLNNLINENKLDNNLRWK